MVLLKELFFENRFPRGWKLIPVLIYLPVGLILAVVRIFIGIQAIIAASLLYKLSSIRSVVIRFMCGVLGIIVVKENDNNEDIYVNLIITNHVSIFDHLAILLLHNSFSVNLFELPSYFHYALKYKDIGNYRNQDVMLQNIKSLMGNDVIVDVQPEIGMTSGQKGLLRFSTWPCKLSCPILPVAIKIWRPPLMEISPTVLNSSWYSDVFWFLFVPFTVFTIKYLPVVKPIKEESAEEMTKRLEKLMADELKIEPTNFTANDKIELEKRLSSEINVVKVASPRINTDSAFIEMASRVKEVLPDVPLSVIYKDLRKTKSVDLTITNFLEGLVKYTPEKNSFTPSVSQKNVCDETKTLLNAAQPSTSFDTSSKTFHKSSHERMISFQERKLRLIQNARKRYIEKHALNVMNSS